VANLTPNGLPPLEGKWWRVISTTPIRIIGLGSSTRIVPGAIFNDSVSDQVRIPGVMEEANLPALARSPQTETLAILRPGELGDVLVALAACRYLRRALPHLTAVALHCHSRFHDLLQLQDEVRIEDQHVPTLKTSYVAVDFRSYFERDHKDGAARVPRLDRVLRTFGFDPPYE
jgi:hypothetical protein